MSKYVGMKKRCNHCASKKIILIAEYFMEDVMHYVYACKACKKLTWRHLVWEPCEINERGTVMNLKTEEDTE